MKNDILVVDDEKDIRHLIAGILQDEGYETRLAWSLDSIKLELVKRIPSLILLFEANSETWSRNFLKQR